MSVVLTAFFLPLMLQSKDALPLSSDLDPVVVAAWISASSAILVTLITGFFVVYLTKKTADIERQAKQRLEALEEMWLKKSSGILHEDLLRKDQAMWEYQVKGVVQIIRSMQRVNPSLSDSEIRLLLEENEYSEEVVEEALKNRRSEVLNSTKEAFPRSLEVFFSYAHEDKKMRLELEKYLSNLKRQGSISSWYDGEIGAGDEWAQEIDRHLSRANIILLLVSQDFIASNYCYEIEMRQAMERHRKGEACVVPIILRPADWEGTPLGKIEALPTGGEPIALWPNRDEAFLNVAKGIQKIVDRLAKNNTLG